MLTWANLLHFYQPPTQKKYWVDRITDEAYRRIFAELKKAPFARLTLNISPLLFEFWERYGHGDVIEDVRSLLAEGVVELTSSAKYHPLLPKLPREEIIRQIKLNDETSRKYLGDLYHPKGFFPPEMAYHPDLAPILEELGFEWVIAEELSFASEFGQARLDSTLSRKSRQVKWDRIYQIEKTKLKIFFRERGISFKILSGQLGTAKLFLDEAQSRGENQPSFAKASEGGYVLTAMDAETFGHHRVGFEKALSDLYGTKEIKGVAISDLLELFPSLEVVKTYPSTWALMEKDVAKNIPFARWEDPGNEIQRMQWELTDLAIRTVKSSKFKVKNFSSKLKIEKTLNSQLSTFNSGRRGGGLSRERQKWLEARSMLDRSLHSDQYWWASARPWWSLEMIERGAKELLDTVFAVPDATSKVKKKAHDLYIKIITTGFEWQRSGRVDELSLKEDEEIRMRTDAAIPSLPKEEIEAMIAPLEKEIKEVVKKKEFERAAQLRNRIKELRDYMREE